MGDGWLESDGISARDLPEWARKDAEPTASARIVLSEHGLAWIDGRRAVIAPWSQVLGVVVHDPSDSAEPRPTAYVLVPRRPPSAPWLEVPAGYLPRDEREDVHAFAARVMARSRQNAYRVVAVKRPLLPRSELVRRVVAHEPIPGAVEVPVGRGPTDEGHARLDIGAALGTVGGGVGGALAGSAWLATSLGPMGILVAATVGAAVVGGVVTYRDRWRRGALAGRTTRPRVLVLAPDGCVVGFPDRVRGFSWDEVTRFVAGTYQPFVDAESRQCLEVRVADDAVAGRIDATWFDGPLELIVGIAEAYRRRATEA
ncbi:MAG: hypothetical protein IT379_01660 [Deltaproteobacteria bacterium]|nr:hypothetical protein [Deltaproteobacteria bacterium]